MSTSDDGVDVLSVLGEMVKRSRGVLEQTETLRVRNRIAELIEAADAVAKADANGALTTNMILRLAREVAACRSTPDPPA